MYQNIDLKVGPFSISILQILGLYVNASIYTANLIKQAKTYLVQVLQQQQKEFSKKFFVSNKVKCLQCIPQLIF